MPPITAIGKRPYLTVQLHNSTSDILEPGHILGYNEPAVSFVERITVGDDEDQIINGLVLKGITPAVPEHSSQFAVALDYIRGTDDSGDGEPGAVGDAAFQGLVPVLVNWTDDAHGKVIVTEGETLLQSSASGITPVWHEEIPDPEYLPMELWALVLLGASTGTSSGPGIFGKAPDGISARVGTIAGTGTLNIWDIDDSGNLTDTGETTTIWNLVTTGAGGGDGFLQAKMTTGGRYILDFEECFSS